MMVIILLGILGSTFLMVMAKRMPALIRSFCYQSFFLFLIIFITAFKENRLDLYVVAGLIFALKVLVIPYFLSSTATKIKVSESLGLFINSQLSLIIALVLTYFSWMFSKNLGFTGEYFSGIAITVAFSQVFIGAFLMISRMKAFTQVIGLLVMENGIFLLGVSIEEGMPFFVEIAIFFDVFVSVIVMGLFVYRINKLFTHIDVNRLSRLKG